MSSTASARSTYEELGQTFATTAFCGAAVGAIEVLAGNPNAAEPALQEACEGCQRANATALLASYSAKLADVLYMLTRFDDAEVWASSSRELATADDRDAQAWSRAVSAKLMARRGDVDAAVAVAADALDVVEHTDALNLRAKVALDYAEVLRAAGRDAEASRSTEQAIELYDLKGNRVAAARARDLLRVTPMAST